MKNSITLLITLCLLSCLSANATFAGGINLIIKNDAPFYGVSSGVSQILPEDSDGSFAEAISSGAGAAATLGAATAGAYAAGAGALAGYAGTASAVSSLGLGSLTTAGAGLLGSSATGAAATAVCTAAVGGPVVMGALVIGTVAATSYGIYKAASWLTSKF